MLTQKNQYTYLRRELATTVLRLYFAGELETGIDRIPVAMIPRDHDHSRCCVYKDRAMIRSRLLSLMGVELETEDDEYTPLSSYAGAALAAGPVRPFPILTVIKGGCSSCTKSKYQVTELCRGCLARPCKTNCPKDAISFQGNRAFIDEEKCVNCGKCRNVCPFSAINYLPVPCEDVCPVGAISKDDYGQVQIDREACIDCGRCSRACPFGAIVERSQILDVAKRLSGTQHTTALVAPSIDGQFPGTLGQILSGLKELGFDQVIEVAQGAQLTVEHEAAELLENKAAGNYMTTSCCSAYVSSVERHIPELMGHVSHTRSPMSYSAEQAKQDVPGTFTVFIGPCIAKKQEGAEDPYVDTVLTFEELAAFFVAEDIDTQEIEDTYGTFGKLPRRFAAAGGVGGAITDHLGDAGDLRIMSIQGLDRKTIRLMKTWEKRPPEADLIEVMCCEEGCIGGPGCIADPRLTKRKFA